MSKTLSFSATLLGLVIIFPVGATKAVDPATVAAVASLTGTAVSLFASGANMTDTSVSQIHVMMKVLHERLQNYDNALLSVMNKLDHMPEQIRREFELALDRDQGHTLNSAIVLILEDVRVIERDNTRPLSDPIKRLHDLQSASRNMMDRDDLNLPYFIAALRIERAFINAIGAVSANRRSNDWNARRETYLFRLEKVYGDRSNSPNLVSRAEQLEEMLSKQLNQLGEQFENLPSSVKIMHRRLNFCESSTRHTNQKAKEMVNRMNEIAGTVKIRQELLVLYRYMVDYAKYTSAILSGMPDVEPPKEIEKGYLMQFDEIQADVQEYADRFPYTDWHSRPPLSDRLCP